MIGPDGLAPLREVIAELGLSARRSLGQNFILDLNLTRRIARLAPDLTDAVVIEIGPGPGGLTRGLLAEGAGQVIAIERDERCLPALHAISEHYPGRLQIVAGDALRQNYVDLLGTPRPEKVYIIANLPYSVATPLLANWLSVSPWPPWYEAMILMFQREVADRIVAQPGSKAYGRLSVLAQWRCDVRIRLKLPPAAFTPAPKVSSAMVEFIPQPPSSPECRLTSLERITAAAFGQRRKMLRTSLASLGLESEALLARVGIDPSLRAERLSVADFCRLARALDEAAEEGQVESSA